jgi:hypothetical protein
VSQDPVADHAEAAAAALTDYDGHVLATARLAEESAAYRRSGDGGPADACREAARNEATLAQAAATAAVAENLGALVALLGDRR